MAKINYQSASAKGVDVTFVAASGGGDTVDVRDGGILLVKNGSGSSIDVTVVVPGNDQYGNARPDIVKAVAAGATTVFGPFGKDLEDKTTHVVSITYSLATSVTVAAIDA